MKSFARKFDPKNGQQRESERSRSDTSAPSGFGHFLAYRRRGTREVSAKPERGFDRITWDTRCNGCIHAELGVAVRIVRQLTGESRSYVRKDCERLLKHLESLPPALADALITISKFAEGAIRNEERQGRFVKVNPPGTRDLFVVPVSLWNALSAEHP